MTRSLLFILFGGALLFLSSCKGYKYLKEDQKLLTKNKIVIEEGKYDTEDLYPFLRQKPNRQTLFLFRIQLGIYNAYNDENLEERNAKKRIKWDEKNARRMEKGKDTLEFAPVWGYRLKHNSGEPPVEFEPIRAEKSVQQISQRLFNKGYFRNQVRYSADTFRHGRKVKVTYYVKVKEPYQIKKVQKAIRDTSLLEEVKILSRQTKLRVGDPYDVEVLDAERSRIVSGMRNMGYYDFIRDYVAFEIDSTYDTNGVKIKVIIKDPIRNTSTNEVSADSIEFSKHEQYRIAKIYLNSSFSPKYAPFEEDTILYEELIIQNASQLKYFPKRLRKAVFINSGDLFSEEAQRYTYSRLTSLNNFKFINIQYEKGDDPNTLNCKINMTPFPRQSLGLEGEGTNSQGNLGISGYLSYNNRNTFGGAEQLLIRLKGGLEAQQTNVVSSGEANPTNTFDVFNTVEYGLETSILLPDLLLVRQRSRSSIPKYRVPRTSLNLLFNFQNRPDFVRTLINTSLKYSFELNTKKLNSLVIYPINASFIDINKSADFQARLDSLNNPTLSATYDSTFILGTQVIHLWSNKRGSVPNYTQNQVNIELAGNSLNLVNSLLGRDKVQKEGESFYVLGDIRYAQFFKISDDIRYYSQLNSHQKMAYRLFGGIGIPYGNTATLPFDKRFFGGGANDIRAWRARSLGPGGMLIDNPNKQGIDQVADIKIEVNAEYRFDLIRQLEGALFVDAGNIWLLNADSTRPNADFDIDRFYKEIAIGAGAGLRLNFGFLLVRFDFGFKIYDPALPEKERWVFNDRPYLKSLSENGFQYEYFTFNLGIDYPF